MILQRQHIKHSNKKRDGVGGWANKIKDYHLWTINNHCVIQLSNNC